MEETKNWEHFEVMVLPVTSEHIPIFRVGIDVPTGEDRRNYIDSFLDSILDQKLKGHMEWEFVANEESGTGKTNDPEVYWDDKKGYHILHAGRNTITLWEPDLVVEYGGYKIPAFNFSGLMPNETFYDKHCLEEKDLDNAKKKVAEIYAAECRKVIDQYRKEAEKWAAMAEKLEKMG